MLTYEHEDTGDNCVACNSRVEPNKYICTTCSLATRFADIGDLEG